MPSTYKITHATEPVPILLSVPHSGVLFPESKAYYQNLIEKPDDTDWFIDQLYDFASDIGITTIKALYSRWVIDLNRDPSNKSLYDDGRVITELVPTRTFLDEPLYRKRVPDKKEIEYRLDTYYWPYHHKVAELLSELRKSYSHVLFFDAHSIKQLVSTIQKQAFPDLTLGNQDGKTCHASLIHAALQVLESSNYNVQHNDPFKGGYLTRSIGVPQNGIHALQLEMTKINYMDKEEALYDVKKANVMQLLLKKMFRKLIKAMEKLNE